MPFEDAPPLPERPTTQPQRRLSAEEVRDLVAAREAGAQIKDLGKQFKIDRATVNNHLRRAGVEPRRWAGKTLSDERLREAGQLYESGLSLRVVAEWVGVDKRYLSGALRGAGFVIRGAGQQRRS